MLEQTPLQLLQGILVTTTITTSARTFSNFPLQVAAKKAKRMLCGKIAKKQTKQKCEGVHSNGNNNNNKTSSNSSRHRDRTEAWTKYRAPCTVWHGIRNCRCRGDASLLSC